jgi:hypothetical protein
VRVGILGKWWTLRFVPASELPKGKDGARDCDGLCDKPTDKGKRILVYDKLSEEETLETVVHEVLHAADWWKDEEWIEHAANDLARILWRLGYRRRP